MTNEMRDFDKQTLEFRFNITERPNSLIAVIKTKKKKKNRKVKENGENETKLSITFACKFWMGCDRSYKEISLKIFQ